MRLCLCPDGDGDEKGTHLKRNSYFCIRRGPFDDILEWPFKHNVELFLIDQLLGISHLTMVVKYSNNSDSNALMKPISEDDTEIGYQFMKLSEMSTTRNIH